MEIERELKTVEFKDVPIGKSFGNGIDTLFIKITSLKLYSTPDHVNAVNLITGKPVYFNPYDYVVLEKTVIKVLNK